MSETNSTGQNPEHIPVTAEELLYSADPADPTQMMEGSPFPQQDWMAAVAATRFGYGARPGELGIIAQDPKGWLLRQLEDNSAPEELNGLTSNKDYMKDYLTAQSKGAKAFDAFLADARQTTMYEIGQHELLAYQTVNPFRERLVRFWVNQFNISGQDTFMYPMTVQFEREVIRPMLNRSLYHLLLTAYRHPIMLTYHNNNKNIGPTSPTGRNSKVPQNESMAREILERHTMGPQGEYTEEDIASLASMFTGWSVGDINSRKPGQFIFRPEWHEGNSKRFMGRIYPEAEMMEVEAALDKVARSPRTGWRLADRMAKEFISDTPPEELLRDMTNGFVETGGNIMGLAYGMINSKHAWDPMPGKIKTPQHLVISTYKSLDKTPINGRELVRHQTVLGQPPYQPVAKAGWPTQSSHWAEPDLYRERLDWLTNFASLNDLNIPPVTHGIEMIGPRLKPSTARHMSVAPTNLDAIALLLCSPEYQRT